MTSSSTLTSTFSPTAACTSSSSSSLCDNDDTIDDGDHDHQQDKDAFFSVEDEPVLIDHEKRRRKRTMRTVALQTRVTEEFPSLEELVNQQRNADNILGDERRPIFSIIKNIVRECYLRATGVYHLVFNIYLKTALDFLLLKRRDYHVVWVSFLKIVLMVCSNRYTTFLAGLDVQVDDILVNEVCSEQDTIGTKRKTLPMIVSNFWIFRTFVFGPYYFSILALTCWWRTTVAVVTLVATVLRLVKLRVKDATMKGRFAVVFTSS